VRVWLAVVVVIVLTTMAALQVTSIREEAPTNDEAVYISSGYSYWRTGDFRLNPEHPPVAKLLVTLPLLMLEPSLPLHDRAWQNADEYAFGTAFLYRNRLPADSILFASRCPTIFVTVLFALAVFGWTFRRRGAFAALVALILFAFDPNIVAHGRYATTDLYLAFFIFVAVVFWNRAQRRGAALDYALAGCALGLAVCTKILGLLLIPIVALLCLDKPLRAPAVLRGFLISAIAAVAVMALVYHGQFYHYGNVVTDSLKHAQGGQLTYLDGTTFSHGRWYFYPIVAALKTPIGIFALAALTVAAVLMRRRLAPDSPVVLVPAAVYAAACIASPIDFGIRILLPIYPFVYVFIALNLPLRRWRYAVAASLAIVIAESVSVYPNYVAFFNSFAGGSRNGARFLLDSNLDWGQDTKRLKLFLQSNGIPAACITYYGAATPRDYGIAELPWPRNLNAADSRELLDCVVAVSVTWLYQPGIEGNVWAWLRERQPDARVGASIYIYDFRKSPHSPLTFAPAHRPYATDE
jgi:hypothetical protein